MGKFGPGKAGSAQKFKERMEASTSDVTFIKNIPGDKVLTVRFLEEPEEWYAYRETYDPDIKRYYPVMDDSDIPEGQRASTRYLVNALDRDTDHVIPLKIPQSLATRLMMRYEKYDTLTDRDYDLTKTGKGLKTEYDVETGDRETIKLSKYELFDHEEVLEEAYDFAMRTETGEEENPLRRKKTKTKAAKRHEVDDDDDDIDDDDDEEETEDLDESTVRSLPIKLLREYARTLGVEVTKKEEILEALYPEDDEDDEDEEPAPKKKGPAKKPTPKNERKFGEEDVEEDEDDGFYTEEQLGEMSIGELRGLARDYGIAVKRDWKRADLIEVIMEESEE